MSASLLLREAAIEVRAMYERGVELRRAMLERLEREARRLGYAVIRLETGCRQEPATALYAACGFRPIAPFGEYADDPTSRCFEKRL